MSKILCGLLMLVTLTVFAETAPEVVEAERLMATSQSASKSVAPEGAATAEMKEPIIPVSAEVDSKAAVATPAENITEKKETDIPVQLDTVKKAGSDHSLYLKAVLSLLVVGGMGLGGYILIGRYRRANLAKSPATQIKILTQHHLGPKKSLAIVRVAGESILIGITDQNISMLKSLALLDEDIPEETPNQFAALFAAKNSQIDEAPRMIAANQGTQAKMEDEEFSISGIKDFVSTRLKNMRTLE